MQDNDHGNGRGPGRPGQAEMSAVTDDRPAINIEDLPVTCVGYLPEKIRAALRLRDLGVIPNGR